MFILDDTFEKLDVDASKLLKLFRSMRDVQMALPGFPSQEASAYLCQYQAGKSVATFAVFHLQRSEKLAFYHSEPLETSPSKADGLLDQGLNFVESMGFLLSDLDVELMEDSDRAMLWESLPLFLGCAQADAVVVEPPPASAKSAPAKSAAAKRADKSEDVSKKAEALAVADTETIPPTKQAPLADSTVSAAPDETEGVDELLAAVENLRTRRPGVASRKKQPSPAEMKKRRLQFKENVGRILASL